MAQSISQRNHLKHQDQSPHTPFPQRQNRLNVHGCTILEHATSWTPSASPPQKVPSTQHRGQPHMSRPKAHAGSTNKASHWSTGLPDSRTPCLTFGLLTPPTPGPIPPVSLTLNPKPPPFLDFLLFNHTISQFIKFSLSLLLQIYL